MAKVSDVSRFLIRLAQEQSEYGHGDPMTNLRLQKLLYFAQGQYLARYNAPLFEDDFLAWDLGPVILSEYEKYKPFGRNNITLPLDESDSERLSDQEKELLFDMLREYDRYATSALVDLSHDPNGPWSAAAKNAIIPKQSIHAFFSRCKPLPSVDDLLAQLPVIQPLAIKNGVPVFSADVAEGWDA